MDAISSVALKLGDLLQLAGVVLSPLLLAPLLLLFLPRGSALALRVSRAVDALSGALLDAAGWLGMAMAAVMLATVILRYVFGESFAWLKDSWIYAFAGCFMLASAGALKSAAHVRVDILFARFSLRTRAVADLAGAYVFLFPLMILILWAYAPQLANAWGAATGRLELSSEPEGLPLLYLFKTLVPVFAATMILQGWSNSMKAACVIVGTSTDAPALASNEEPHA